MKLKDIPYNGWYFGLRYRSIQDKTLEAIEGSETTTEAKKKIIVDGDTKRMYLCRELW